MYTKKQLIECACRELKKRRDNYPKWVAERRMTQVVATEQIDMMNTIYRILLHTDEAAIAQIQK